MRSFLAAADLVLRRHLRGPAFLLAVALYTVLGSTAPAVGGPDSLLRVRLAADHALGSGFLVLLLLAVVLPLASVRWARPGRLGAALGPFGVQGACLVAHGLFLLVTAVALGALSYGMLRLRHGFEAAERGGSEVRTVVARRPGAATVLTREAPALAFGVSPDELAGTGGRVKVRFRPRVAVQLAGGARPAGVRFRVQASWRVRGDDHWTELQPLALRRSREEAFTVAAGREALARGLEIRLAKGPGPYLVGIEDGSVWLLGAPASMLGALLRGFVLVGAGAASVMALVLWLSRFTSYPIAVAAGLTTAAASAFFLGDVLPGVTAPDPGRWVARGAAVGWEDLAPTGLKALGMAAVALLLPFRDPRVVGP